MSTQLVPQSPLMRPITYQGQTYYSSQYFHAQYLANSPHGGKYRRHPDFVRVLRSIPAYAIHLDHADVVELDWKTTKANSALVSDFNHLSRCFADAGFHTITLLNDVAQLALSHHMDDAISQQLSVAINTAAASGSSSRALRHARSDFEDALAIMNMLAIPLHRAQQEAVKMVEASTGVPLRHLLAAAPAQDHIPEEALRYEPTELAARLGWGANKGRAMNQALAGLGWQVRAIGGGWEPTPTGQPHCDTHAWASEHSTKSGYNLKWSFLSVRDALRAVQTQP